MPNRSDTGFTLIEIIAVLVLMGILAAAATPKFLDLGAGSKRLAAGTALNEAQVRINARFSRLMYAGLSCEATGTENGGSGDNESGSSGSSSESGNSTSTGGGGSSASGSQGNLDPALTGVKVFDWESVESTVTLPAGQLLLYDGKYYVAKMTAVVDTVANKPVGDDALTAHPEYPPCGL